MRKYVNGQDETVDLIGKQILCLVSIDKTSMEITYTHVTQECRK